MNVPCNFIHVWVHCTCKLDSCGGIINNEIHKALVHSYVNSSGLAYVLITTVHCKPVESNAWPLAVLCLEH